MQPGLAAVVIQQGDGNDAAGRVAHQALHEDASARAGAEDDGPLGAVTAHGLVGAPGADDEPSREHAHDGEGEGDERHGARQLDQTEQQGEHGEREARDRGGPGHLGGLLEGAQLMPHRVRAEQPPDAHVHDDDAHGARGQGCGVELGDLVVQAQPQGDRKACRPHTGVEGGPEQPGAQAAGGSVAQRHPRCIRHGRDPRVCSPRVTTVTT